VWGGGGVQEGVPHAWVGEQLHCGAGSLQGGFYLPTAPERPKVMTASDSSCHGFVISTNVSTCWVRCVFTPWIEHKCTHKISM
jgi:hypothetical protein